MTDPPIPVTAVGRVEPAVLATLAAELGERRTLAQVLAWARALSPPRAVVEIVTQDEFTHDVVLAWDDATHFVLDAN